MTQAVPRYAPLASPTNLNDVATCDFCGGREFYHVTTRPDRADVVACTRCGLAFLYPMPSREEIAAIYAESSYFTKDSSSDSRFGYPAAEYLNPTAHLQYANEQLDLLESCRVLSGTSLLEIGCGTGEFLHAARSRGAKVVGAELSRWAAERARQAYALEVRCGTMEELSVQEARYEALVAREVIEHLPSPCSFFSQAAELITDRGLLVLTTPNFRIGVSRPQEWVGFQRSFEHLYFFSDEMLIRYGRRFGFELLSWWTRGTSQCVPVLGPVTQPAAIRAAAGARKLIRRLGRPLKRFVRILLEEPSRTPWIQYGDGHELLMLFEKLPRSTASDHD